MVFMPCPLCNKRYPTTFLPYHASSCNPKPRPTIKKNRNPSHSNKRLLPHVVSPRPTTSQRSNLQLQPKQVAKLRPLQQPLPLPSPKPNNPAPGFYVLPHAFSANHLDLARLAESTPPTWHDYRFREAKNYGPSYDLARRRFLFGPANPPPTELPHYARADVIPHLRSLHALLSNFQPNQLSVNHYRLSDRKGAHIMPHNDCENAHIATAVVGVCLRAACVMTLILRSSQSPTGAEVKRDVSLLPGAVYIMSGESLRTWHHAIFPGNVDNSRISLTFRDVGPHQDSSH